MVVPFYFASIDSSSKLFLRFLNFSPIPVLVLPFLLCIPVHVYNRFGTLYNILSETELNFLFTNSWNINLHIAYVYTVPYRRHKWSAACKCWATSQTLWLCQPPSPVQSSWTPVHGEAMWCKRRLPSRNGPHLTDESEIHFNEIKILCVILVIKIKLHSDLKNTCEFWIE